MKASEIQSFRDAHTYCTGVLRDFENGITSFEEALENMFKYTIQLHELLEIREKKNAINFHSWVIENGLIDEKDHKKLWEHFKNSRQQQT